MPTITLKVPERGLHPIEAAHAWRLHTEDDMSYESLRDEVSNMMGKRPSEKAVRNAVARVEATTHGHIHGNLCDARLLLFCAHLLQAACRAFKCMNL